ncbi:hypothetical protein EK904_000019 [Melospiza melodia maxima]|nr:hypothetical protein EK904_000019 [Melospiza melodia maxima]
MRKTRTREKYRVVYTDHQRLELEKEFHYNRYITIRRKSELAANLRLSERQVKIWFQNRRAKERKLMKKKLTHFDGSSSLGSLQSDSGSRDTNIDPGSILGTAMYVSSLLEKEPSMYPGPARANNSLPVQNFVSAPAYSDYMGYHPVAALDSHGQPAPAWGSHYGPQREDWGAYGPGPSSAAPAAHINGSSPGQGSYSSADYSSLHPAAAAAPLPPVDTIHAQQISPNSQRHSSYEWMRKTVQTNTAGKTRTKEKYRVVYTDHQRLELEKEFHCNRYITIRRKSELAANLGLSERQVKIWFQNRRAKERKMIKKKISQFDGSGGSAQSDSGSLSPNELSNSLFPPPHAINGLQPNDIHQVIVSE